LKGGIGGHGVSLLSILSEKVALESAECKR
jgi:hypothetical protein